MSLEGKELLTLGSGLRGTDELQVKVNNKEILKSVKTGSRNALALSSCPILIDLNDHAIRLPVWAAKPGLIRKG